MRQVVLIRGPGIDLSPGEMLGEAARLDVISTGNLLREHIEHRTLMGERMNAHMQAGELVPDELVVDAVVGALANVDRGWVLSGFPNTIGQAVLLTDRGYMPDTVIELALVEDEIDQHPRLAAKREILQVTLPLYQQQVEPLRRYYQTHSAFHAISGTGHHEEVGAALVAIVSAG